MSELSDENRMAGLDDQLNPLHSTSSSVQSTDSSGVDPPGSAIHQSPALQSEVFRNLAEPCSPLEDKVRAGYRLIDYQKRDIARMMNKVSDLQAAREEKQTAVHQLYAMVEQVQPLLTQLSGWTERVAAEESELLKKIKAAKSLSGIPEEAIEN